MRGQQDGKRKTANSMLSRVQPQHIMRRHKRGEKNDTVARVIIWRNARVVWGEKRLPGNVARLLNTGGSAHIHGIIPEGSDL